MGPDKGGRGNTSTTRMRHTGRVSVYGLLLTLSLVSTAYPQPTATLTWNANVEADLAGYEVFRLLAPCPTDPAGPGLTAVTRVAKVTTWSDPALPTNAAVVCYGIKAFDTSNNISLMSNLVSKEFARPVPQLLGHWTQKTDVPHAPEQNLKAYTIHAVVNPKAPLDVFSPVLVKNYTYFFYAAVKGYCGTGGILAGHGATGRVCDPTPLEPGKWTAVTATYDGTTLTLYKNRVVLKSGANPPPADSTNLLQIGGSQYNETCNCDQEVWLYDQAMTATEVANLPSGPISEPIIRATPDTLAFQSEIDEPDPMPETVRVENAGTGTLTWTATSDQPWLKVVTEVDQFTVEVQRGTLPVGSYRGTITVTATSAQPVQIPVTLKIIPNTMLTHAPTNVRMVNRPSPTTVTLAWTQPGAPPVEYRLDRFVYTGWRELMRVPGDVVETVAPLPEVGRRQFRVCAITDTETLCNNREGVWVSR